MSKRRKGELIDFADKYFKEEKFEKALHSYREILGVYPEITPDTQISLIGKIVMCLYKTEQYSKAPQELERFEKLFKPGSIPYAKFQTMKANVYNNLGSFNKALVCGKTAFEVLRPTGEMETFAKAQQILGVAYFSKGDLENARKFLEGALFTYRRLGDEEGVLYSVNRLSQQYFIASRWHQAIENLKEGLNISENTGRKEWTASFSLNLGMTYSTIGDWELAMKYLYSGISSSEDLGHLLGTVRGRISLAFLHRLQRRWDEAIKLLEKCRRLCEKEGYKRELYLCYEGLGEVAFDREDYTTAEKYYSKAVNIVDETAPEGDMAVEIHRRLAELSVAVNEPEKGLNHADSALRIAKKLGDKFEEACTHRAYALVYQKLGEPEKANQSFIQAIRFLENLGEKYERARTLLEFSKFLGSVDKGDEAIHYLLKAKELFERLPSVYWMGRVELEIARIRFNKGGTDLAIISLDKAVDLFSDRSCGKGPDEKEALAECSTLRESIERLMVETSLRASHHTIPDDSPENLLKFLVKKTGATRAFVGLLEHEGSEIKASHNLKAEDAKRLSEVLNPDKLENPIISTNLESSTTFPLAQRDGIRSFILIPFGPERERGILYLDRKCPFTQKDLTLSVRLAGSFALKLAQIRQEELKAENLRLRKELERRGYPDIITQDKQMLKILELVDKLKGDSAPVLVEGETGTGKELIARAIHYKGSRATKPFIALDCGAIPETLAENELFGHKKGSFTDAKENKPGLFELANGGTLFLDEVSNLSLRTQAKLLRVLQERKVRRIGEARERKVDVRIIAASNKRLEDEISKGRFREDLYHRLKVMEINIPPLRERKDDIPLLVQHFVEEYSIQRKKKVQGITNQALTMLCNYDWPGNVRQLKNEIERAIILMEDGWITPAHFSATVKRRRSESDKKSYTIQQIVKALKENNWVKRKAARALGIPESTLRRRLKVHRIEVPTKP